jgi:tetratricopeptide (TPR) repeat protein
MLCRLASFGIFWFFITLSVESSIIKIRDVIFEHRLYLPSVGFFLAVVAISTLGIIPLARNFKDFQKIILPLVSAIIIILAGMTYSRNNVWRDWISIWSDTVSKSPGKPRAHNVLGIGYFYGLKFDEALREYEEAVRLKPDFIEAYYNMGLIYKAKKMHVESLTMFLKALSMSAFNADHFAKTYNEIGINYAELGELDRAVEALATAMKYNPESVEFRNNYAFVLRTRGDLDAALREYQAIIAIDPGNIYATMAIMEITSLKQSGGSKK